MKFIQNYKKIKLKNLKKTRIYSFKQLSIFKVVQVLNLVSSQMNFKFLILFSLSLNESFVFSFKWLKSSNSFTTKASPTSLKYLLKVAIILQKNGVINAYSYLYSTISYK